MQYLRLNEGQFGSIVLAVNLDGVGYRRGRTAYSLYDCLPPIAEAARAAFAAYDGIIEGESWYQGDHMIFLMQQCPAIAFTSEQVMEIMTQIAHTAQDAPDQVDVRKLAETAHALRDLLRRLDAAA
jgi:aminopeptidase YwaD